MEVIKKDNSVVINGKEIVFNHEVEKVLTFPKYCVVWLKYTPDYGNNVEAYDYEGNKVWNISQVVKLGVPEAYTILFKETETVFSALSYSGVEFYVDTTTDTVIDQKIRK